jgi:hypothetical protein
LSPTKLSETSLYDIIINEVKKTPEWNIGYNKTIGTVESGGESDKFLISGLSIKDTYRFADEDEITEESDIATLTSIAIKAINDNPAPTK